MGEIADMMLDGTMCAGCGVYLEEEGFGIPQYCSDDCMPDDYKKSLKPEKIECKICGKKCGGQQGLWAHRKQVHKDTYAENIEGN